MRVLIPGISGGLGQAVARVLHEAGHEVSGIDRRPWRDAPPGVTVYEVDLRKRGAEDVFRKLRPEVVVHMATVTHLQARSEERYRINLGGTRAVIDYATSYGAKHMVFVGRHTYYGAAPDSPLYHTEDEPPMALSNFPELADLVAADLYACTALWRRPEFKTTVLRFCYTLGPSLQGTLAAFLKSPRVPTVLGYDPLFQFIHEQDVAKAVGLAVAKAEAGVFNVSGPSPVPFSTLIREVGAQPVPIPEKLLTAAMGRFGLPRLPQGALGHLKYPIVIDGAAFRNLTGFQHDWNGTAVLNEMKEAFFRLRSALG
jgi:UDP-glucose 4-epimerase